MNSRITRNLTACALALLAGGTLVGQTGADPAPSDGQIKLTKALARLDKITPQLDAQTRKNLPHIKSILAHVYLHPESATPTEFKIANAILPTGADSRDIFDDVAETKATTTVQTAVQTVANTAIQFVAAQDTVPGGQTKGVVYLKNPDLPEPKALVEIPNGTSKFTVEQRAQVVAKRLEAEHSSDPLWWTNLEVHQIKDQYVVAVKGSGDAYVITADKDFAKLQGETPEALAFSIVDQIRSTIDPNTTRGFDATSKLTPLQRANVLRESGDDLYTQKDLSSATEAYLRAIKIAPTYAVPYLRLADLYVEQQKVDDAKDILQQAQDVAGMSPDDKATIAQKLTQVSSAH
jgi:tetratricopeptide (TPR) repeat protein